MTFQRYLPHLALIGANLIWAFAYPLYSLVMPRHINAEAMLCATLICTAILSLIPLLWKKGEKVHRRDIAPLVGAAILIAIIRKGMLLLGVSMTSPIDASIISTISPIVVLIISVVIGIDSFNSRKIIGLLAGTVGAVGVILTGVSPSHAGSSMMGNILVLICAFITAIYIVWFKSLLKRYEPLTILRWTFCIAAILYTPFGIEPLLKSDLSGLEPLHLAALLYAIIMPTYIPNLLQNYALQYVQPTISSIYTYLRPLVAGAITIYMGLDTPQFDTIIYALLIFFGVGVVIISYNKTR
ncbi:MAG: DMT family transporter [Rikenellaceae bacterium]